MNDQRQHGPGAQVRTEGEGAATIAMAGEDDEPGHGADGGPGHEGHQHRRHARGADGETERHAQLHVAEAHARRAGEVDDEQESGEHGGAYRGPRGDGAVASTSAATATRTASPPPTAS